MEKIKKLIIEAIQYSLNHSDESYTSIAKKFNVGRHTISKYRENKSYEKFKFKSVKEEDKDFLFYFSEQEIEAINNYSYLKENGYPKFSSKYPGAPRDLETYYSWLEKFGIKFDKKKKQTYHYNKDKFQIIDSEEKAYWLGFILADGCIVQDNRLSFSLAEKDKEHLKNFCRFLEMPENEIDKIIKNSFGGAYDKDNPTVILNICSKKIVDDLKDKNIFARKSCKEIPYLLNDKELERHYIRGILDGDGYIRSTQYGLGIVGSLDVCKYIYNYINNNVYDISNISIHPHDKIYKLAFSGIYESYFILDYFYKDATISLERKRLLYEEYGIAVSKSEKKSGRLNSAMSKLIRGEGYTEYNQPQRIESEKI